MNVVKFCLNRCHAWFVSSVLLSLENVDNYTDDGSLDL